MIAENVRRRLQQTLLFVFLAVLTNGVGASDSEAEGLLPQLDSVAPNSLEAFEALDVEGNFVGCITEFTVFEEDSPSGSGGDVMLRGALSSVVIDGGFGMVFQLLPFDVQWTEELSKGTAKIFVVSYAYLNSVGGTALPDKDPVDDCEMVELEDSGFCRHIQDDYANPVIGAMMTGAFGITYTRVGDDTEFELRVAPQRVANYQQYRTEMSACMQKKLQMLRDQGYGG